MFDKLLEKCLKEARKLSRSDQHRAAVLYQELVGAKRNIDGIKRDMEQGKLPKDHPALAINQKKFERAKEELRKLGFELEEEEK